MFAIKMFINNWGTMNWTTVRTSDFSFNQLSAWVVGFLHLLPMYNFFRTVDVSIQFLSQVINERQGNASDKGSILLSYFL